MIGGEKECVKECGYLSRGSEISKDERISLVPVSLRIKDGQVDPVRSVRHR